MALARTTLLGANSGTSGNKGTGTYVTGSFTPPNNSLLVVGLGAMENGSNTDLLSALTITDSLGTHLTYTPRVSTHIATTFDDAAIIWTAPVTTGAAMTLTFDAGALSVGVYSVSVVAYTGYNTGTPIGATASGNAHSGFTGPPTPESLTLSAAPASDSEVFAIIDCNKSTTGITPGSTFTELHDVFNSDWGGFESEVRTGSTSTTVDWVDVRPAGGAVFDFAAVAVEIKAASAGGSDHAGAVTPTAVATLAPAAHDTRPGSVTGTAVATLAPTGVHVRPAAAAGTAVATFAPTPHQGHAAAIAAGVTASATPTPAQTHGAAITGTAAATLTPAFSHGHAAAVAASAAATLTPAAIADRAAAITAAAQPALFLSPSGHNQGAAAGTATAELTAAELHTRAAAVALGVAATLTAGAATIGAHAIVSSVIARMVATILNAVTRDITARYGRPELTWRLGPPELAWHTEPPELTWNIGTAET